MWQFHSAARATALLLLSLAMSSCGAVPASSTSPATPEATATRNPPSPSVETDIPAGSEEPAATDELAARTVAVLDLGGGPDLPTEAFGSLWVLAVDGPLMNDGTEPAVHRIDPATNEVVATIPLPGRLCQGIGPSPEAMWACGPDGLSRIDPATNEIVATVELDAALVVSRIAYGAGSVWAFATASVGPDLVVRIDPATNAVTATIELERTAGAMAFGFDALWVTSPVDNVLLRIDPATNVVEERTRGIDMPGVIAIGEDAVWVSLLAEKGSHADEGDPTVVRVDPRTGDVVASIATGGSLEVEGEIAATADAIWVRAPDPWLVRIDPATNEVVERIDTISGPGAVAFAFDSIWVTTERGEVLRLNP
ncbi:MAG: hypothetical protein M3406_11210 [Chloroflexota bacterium]|nr:hypothetical protein [Chloroflexota bacterium]